MCKTTNKIHRAKSSNDLTNQQIADRMGSHLRKTISHDIVQKYFTGNAGVPLENIGALFAALGLKVVELDQEVISLEKLNALKLLAKESLEGSEG